MERFAGAATLAGEHFAGASLNVLARGFGGSQVQLAPVARLLGEPELGIATGSALSAFEGLFFGAGLAVGLLRAPLSPARQPPR